MPNTILHMPKTVSRVLRRLRHACVALLCAALTGCMPGTGYKYKIGVSQCVGGRWREKANNEMLAAQHLYGHDVKVVIKNADGDNSRQCRQIDSLADMGVDLLVVSPNDRHVLNKSLLRARRKGIPVVFFDRTTSIGDYTAYIGGDNIDAGRQTARYAARLCRDSMHVAGRRPVALELTGPQAISPARDRHTGFAEVMKGCPYIDYRHVPTLWSYADCRAVMTRWLKAGRPADVVFCHSDLAAMGAHDAAKALGKAGGMRFIGIDGLAGEGMDAVQSGVLAASYIYPTHGEEVVALALKILEGQPYCRTNMYKSFVVTPQNVGDIAISTAVLMKQNRYLATIQNKLETYLGFYGMLRTLLAVALAVIVLLAVAVLSTLKAIKATRRANRRMREMNDEQTRFITNASHQLRTPLTLIAGPLQQLAQGKGDSGQLLGIIERNVAQLQTIVSDVLLFRKANEATVDDTTAPTAQQLSESERAVQESRRQTLVDDNADELSTVLIVDDNADMRAYLRTLLLDRYYVIEASDGQSGLRLAVESVPDLVVSDVMMPVMDGLALCARLKQDQATSHIPVILLTARSTERQQIEGMHNGADMYMAKPFCADVLLANMASLLRNRRQLRRLWADGAARQGDDGKAVAQSPDRQWLDMFFAAMEKHMADTRLKVEDIGDEMGLSRVQLYRKVKALTGLSPVEILREVRLKKAYTLLQTTDKTVAEIAGEVGFATPGYFSSCFRKQYDKYPTEVRGK